MIMRTIRIISIIIVMIKIRIIIITTTTTTIAAANKNNEIKFELIKNSAFFPIFKELPRTFAMTKSLYLPQVFVFGSYRKALFVHRQVVPTGWEPEGQTTGGDKKWLS